jgi:hypothetical protein
MIPTTENHVVPFTALGLLVAYRFAFGGGGGDACWRSALWGPVGNSPQMTVRPD